MSLKQHFDKLFPGSSVWNCVAGRHFGSYVTHDSKQMIYMQVGQMNILLFR
jgi:dynein light chain LC8-type